MTFDELKALSRELGESLHDGHVAILRVKNVLGTLSEAAPDLLHSASKLDFDALATFLAKKPDPEE